MEFNDCIRSAPSVFDRDECLTVLFCISRTFTVDLVPRLIRYISKQPNVLNLNLGANLERTLSNSFVTIQRDDMVLTGLVGSPDFERNLSCAGGKPALPKEFPIRLNEVYLFDGCVSINLNNDGLALDSDA
ncbi:hypothetical protein C438_05302 [Haloferax denitrificans ATCC 35960]|uniref:Uncharacterized protein n=1 Tax=Haloferax denitrificans ATCC 35960 TaxID=662478 RepID=M0JF08_9EURY|nr:hypothetical protein C438_05302 [Haloferax denitrificans ATCC 35960]